MEHAFDTRLTSKTLRKNLLHSIPISADLQKWLDDRNAFSTKVKSKVPVSDCKVIGITPISACVYIPKHRIIKASWFNSDMYFSYWTTDLFLYGYNINIQSYLWNCETRCFNAVFLESYIPFWSRLFNVGLSSTYKEQDRVFYRVWKTKG